eukprot:PhF_6_TR11010/c0_g1_i2/m.17828
MQQQQQQPKSVPQSRRACKPVGLSLDVSHAQKSHIPVSLVTTYTSPDSTTLSCLPLLSTRPTFLADMILEYLYLGSFSDAMQRSVLQERGITHILNVAREVDSTSSSSSSVSSPDSDANPTCEAGCSFSNITYKKIEIDDHSDEDIGSHFEECLEFIASAKAAGGKVLVHCRQGISRSPTIVIAHLMREFGWTLNQSIAFVQSKREEVCPNIGFILTLEEFGLSSRGGSSVDSGEVISTPVTPILLHCDDWNLAAAPARRVMC